MVAEIDRTLTCSCIAWLTLSESQTGKVQLRLASVDSVCLQWDKLRAVGKPSEIVRGCRNFVDQVAGVDQLMFDEFSSAVHVPHVPFLAQTIHQVV